MRLRHLLARLDGRAPQAPQTPGLASIGPGRRHGLLKHGALQRKAQTVVQVAKLLAEALPGGKQLAPQARKAACPMPATAENTTPRYLYSGRL